MAYWHGFGFLGAYDGKKVTAQELSRQRKGPDYGLPATIASKNPDVGTEEKPGGGTRPAPLYRPKGQEATVIPPARMAEEKGKGQQFVARRGRAVAIQQRAGRGIARGTAIQRKHDSTQELEAAALWRATNAEDLTADEIAEKYKVGKQMVDVPEEVQRRSRDAVINYILQNNPPPTDMPMALYVETVKAAAEGGNELERYKKRGDRPLPGKMTAKGELIIPPSLRDSLIRAERERGRLLNRQQAYEFFLLEEGRIAQSITDPQRRVAYLTKARERAEKRADSLMEEYKATAAANRARRAEAEFLKVDVERIAPREEVREVSPLQLTRKDEKALIEARRDIRRQAQAEKEYGSRSASPEGGYRRQLDPVEKMRAEARERAEKFKEEEAEAGKPAILRRSRSMSGLGAISGGTILLGVASVAAVVGGLWIVYRTMQPKAG